MNKVLRHVWSLKTNLTNIQTYFNHFTWGIQLKSISNPSEIHTNNSKYSIKLFITKLGPISTVTAEQTNKGDHHMHCNSWTAHNQWKNNRLCQILKGKSYLQIVEVQSGCGWSVTKAGAECIRKKIGILRPKTPENWHPIAAIQGVASQKYKDTNSLIISHWLTIQLAWLFQIM